MIKLEDGIEIGYITNMHFIKLHRAKYYVDYFCYAVALHNLWVMIKSKIQSNSFNVPVFMFVFVLLITVIAEFLDVSIFMGVT